MKKGFQIRYTHCYQQRSVAMDVETFFTVLYVMVDDWYQSQVARLPPKGGRPARLSDSEVLTLAIAAHWRGGVAWGSERGFVRYMQQHGTALFPNMLQRSAFNRRVRYLFGLLVELQHALSAELDTIDALYEAVDSLEMPAFSLGHAQRQKSHWLWESTLGRGAHGHWMWGDFLLMSVNPAGVIMGWLVGTAAINDHWLLEAFLSARWGCPRLVQPPIRRQAGWSRATPLPTGYMGGFQAVGTAQPRPYLADQGFGGQRWSDHWREQYQVEVITIPQDHVKTQTPWSPDWKRWLAQYRQPIETTFAVLVEVFAIKRLDAHSRWGQLTRIAAKVVGYLLGICLNRRLGRPDLAHRTLLC
jgi:hypothetical protein